MKKFLYTSLVALAGFFAVSCQQEHIEVVYDPAAVTVQTLGEFADVVLDKDGEKIVTTFAPADFKLAVATAYQLNASASSDMANKVKVSASIDIDEKGLGTISIKQTDLNALVYALGGVADEPMTLYFQLSASVATDKKAAIGATTKESNIVSAVFTPYPTVVKDVTLYDHVWVIGSSASVGSWSFEKVYQYLYDYEKKGETFTGLIDFGEAGPSGGFKLTGAGNWDDASLNWGSEAQAEEAEAESITLLADGGSKDIKCYSHRYYFFSLDRASLVLTKKYSFDNVGIVGAFNGWAADDANMKMTYNDQFHRFYIDQTFAEDTELKFTCDDKWDLNWGGEDGKTAGNGANIKVAAGSYRIYLDLNYGEYSLDASMFGKDEPTGEEDKPDEPVAFEGWGVVGTINDWGTPDIHMTQSGDFWVVRDVELGSGDQFKFRKDEDWAENIGASGEVEPFVVEVGTKYEGVNGGKNLSVPAAGTYDLYVNPEAKTFYVMAAGEVPGEIATWGVVGTINNWGESTDLAMTEDGDMWVRKGVSLTTSDQFKVRFQNGWDVNRGAPGSVEPFIMGADAIQAVAGGKNLGVAEDGEYDVYYDELNEVLFVVKSGESLHYWGVVGDLTGWGGNRRDYTMFKEGDFYVRRSLEIAATNQFKIRYDSGWDVNRGAPGSTEPFKVDANTVVDATEGGKNLGVNEDGKYDLYYNPTDEKLYVMAEGEAPDGAGEPEGPTAPDSWGLVGDMTGWADGADIVMTKNGDWYYAKGVTFAAEQKFKIRGDGAWNFERGAEGEGAVTISLDTAIGVVAKDGKDMIVPTAGTYDVYWDTKNEKVYVMTAGTTPEGYVAYPDYIYVIGGDSDWQVSYPLAGDGQGVFVGFTYLSKEFKFKPHENDWDGDLEYDEDGKIADIANGPNIPAPATAAYYRITVDLVNMTYTLTAINSISIIGTVNGNWDTDTDLTYNSESGAWEAKDVTLNAGKMKFRSNHDWGASNPDWGGKLDALVVGGSDIEVAAGTYDIKLFALCNGKAYATMTAKD